MKILDGTSSVTPHTPDWDEVAEALIQSALGEIPEVGSLLGSIVSLFWPRNEGTDVWDAIKAKVEALIDQKISANDYNLVLASLRGLKNDMDDYLRAAREHFTPGEISTKWDIANGDFDQQYPTFQLSGYQYLLLPLFSKMALMNIILLRDGALFGADWGWNNAQIADVKRKLKARIDLYIEYTAQTMTQLYGGGDNPVPMPKWVGQYNEMMKGVMVYYHYWPYFHHTERTPVKDVPTPPFETYYGPVASHPDFYYPKGFKDYDLDPKGYGLINYISVWGRNDPSRRKAVAGFRLAWANNFGPLMGPNIYRNKSLPFDDGNHDKNTPPSGNTLLVDPANPIIQVMGNTGDVVDSIAFRFKDNSVSGTYGDSSRTDYNFRYPADADIKPEDPLVLSAIVMNQGMYDGYIRNGEGYFCSGLLFGFRNYLSYSEQQRKFKPHPVPLQQGSYWGEARSSQSSSCYLQLNLQDGNVSGSIVIRPPLAGTGGIRGTYNDAYQILTFTSTSPDRMTINWTGTLHADGSVSGSYDVQSGNSGTWNIKRYEHPRPIGYLTGTVKNNSGLTDSAKLTVYPGSSADRIDGFLGLGGNLSGGGAFTDGRWNHQTRELEFETHSSWDIIWTGTLLANGSIVGTYKIRNIGQGGTWSVSLA